MNSQSSGISSHFDKPTEDSHFVQKPAVLVEHELFDFPNHPAGLANPEDVRGLMVT